MEVDSVRNVLSFMKGSEILNADRGVTVDIEKTFHCAASKGLVGHLAFVLEPQNPLDFDAKWGTLFDTSLTFARTQNVDDIGTFLYGHGWTPPARGEAYRGEAYRTACEPIVHCKVTHKKCASNYLSRSCTKLRRC